MRQNREPGHLIDEKMALQIKKETIDYALSDIG